MRRNGARDSGWLRGVRQGLKNHRLRSDRWRFLFWRISEGGKGGDVPFCMMNGEEHRSLKPRLFGPRERESEARHPCDDSLTTFVERRRKAANQPPPPFNHQLAVECRVDDAGPQPGRPELSKLMIRSLLQSIVGRSLLDDLKINTSTKLMMDWFTNNNEVKSFLQIHPPHHPRIGPPIPQSPHSYTRCLHT